MTGSSGIIASIVHCALRAARRGTVSIALLAAALALSAAPVTAQSITSIKLMVRLADGVAPDWDALAPRFSAALGIAATPERRIANVWVLALAQPQTQEQLVALAETLQQDPLVQYADPVLRKHALGGPVPN